MIGRLGISSALGGQSTSSSSSGTSRGSITSTTGSMMNMGAPSMPSLSGFSTGFTNMTKKVTETLAASTTDGDKKTKDDARKLQIAQAVQIMEDVSLQSPSTHLGLVLAYTSRNSSPVIHPGLKFTWFRMRGQDHIDQMEESQRAWYAPSVDDIGCTICVQCEDNFDQGLSRYLECGPLQTDPLLRSTTESAISSGFFETKGICVSLGLSESEETPATLEQSDPAALHTTLSKESAFLQLNGRCIVEVDEHGIFISIPTFHSAARLSQQQRHHTNSTSSNTTFHTSRRGLRLPVSAQMKVQCSAPAALILSVPLMQAQAQTGDATKAANASGSVTSKDVDDGESSEASSPTKTTSSRLMSSENIEVNNNASTSDNQQPADEKDRKSLEDEEAMRNFLSSSILSIPWTYEGHNLSPEAYINGLGSRLSPEEKEKLLKEAEEDAMIFAQTVVALTEFIACVPEGSKELLLCFSCPDRLTRDTMVLSMRALACKKENTSRYERRKVLPWVQLDEDDGASSDPTASASSVGNSSNINEIADYEWKKRLKTVEEESANLKRERNELTKQLLETREELSLTKQKMNKLFPKQAHGSSFVGNLSISNSSVHSTAGSQAEAPLTQRSTYSEEDLAGLSDHNYNNTSSGHGLHAQGGGDATASSSHNVEVDEEGTSAEEDVSTITDTRVLQQKLLELENKLSLATKKDQEISRQREELEQQNNKLSSELDAAKRKKGEAKDKFTTLQRLHDQQAIMMRKMEEEIDSLLEKNAALTEKTREMEKLQNQLLALETKVEQLQQENVSLQSNLVEQQRVLAQHQQEIDQVTAEHATKASLLQNSLQHLEQQLSEAMMDNKRQEREVLQQREVIEKQEAALHKVKHLEKQLQTTQEEKMNLQAEINHLQKKTDSLVKDLKRAMKENAQAISEFEKALIRKSGECDELYFQLMELRDMEKARMQASANEDSAGAAILARISSVLSSSGTAGSGTSGMGQPQSSTHSTGSIDSSSTSDTGGALSSRMTNMFRRMSSSAATFAATVGTNNGTGQEDA